MSYVITTDSCSDLSTKYLEKRNIGMIPLIFTIDGKDHFDDIFPLKKPQTDFAAGYASKCSCNTLLDIGCATGNFAAKMKDYVDRVSAFDVDRAMIDIAAEKHADQIIDYRVGDMRCLDNLYNDKKFDMITCFGNTLVHLDNHEIQTTLTDIKNHLNHTFLMQILNYDYIHIKAIYFHTDHRVYMAFICIYNR